MAKSKKKRVLAGAALAAHLKKVGRKAVKKEYKKQTVAPKPKTKRKKRPVARRAAPKVKRKRHQVARYHRKGGHVKSYNRHGANVKQHWSNPFGGGIGANLMEGLMTAGVVLGTLYVVGVANRQLEKFQATQSGWGNLAGKLAIALGAGYGASMAVQKKWIRPQHGHVIMGAAFLPLSLGILNQFVPQVAGQISLAEEEGMDRELGMTHPEGARISDYMMNAELQGMEAELEAENDSTY